MADGNPVPHGETVPSRFHCALIEALSLLFFISPAQLFTSVIYLEEIRFDTLIGPPGNRLGERTELKVLSRVTLVPIDRTVALLAARLRADWKMRGTPVGYREGLIAATAEAHDLILVTRNVKHFDHLPGLKVENWFE